MPTDVHPVGRMTHISQHLRLTGEAFAPTPVGHEPDQREIAVGIAFGVEPAARIPVPVPGAADIGRRLYPADLQPIPGQQIGLIDSGDPRPDHHCLIWAGVFLAPPSASPVPFTYEL